MKFWPGVTNSWHVALSGRLPQEEDGKEWPLLVHLLVACICCLLFLVVLLLAVLVASR